jgi:hypothetical protein
MIIDLHFGYADRHHIYYDTQRKRGTIKLWSSYSGSITGADWIRTRAGSRSELNTQQETPKTTFFRANQQTEFLLADENDVLSMLASLVAVLNGDQFSFTSKEGRKITFSLKKEGKWEKDIITVKLQYGKAGKLTISEAHKLHTIAREILRDLGYSDQAISERLESVRRRSSN